MILPKKSDKFSQSEVLSSICHEFKTPTAAILALSEILREDLSDTVLARLDAELAKEVKECIEKINETAAELLELANDFLDTSNHGVEDFKINRNNQVDIAEIINRSVQLNYDYSLKKNIRIQLAIDPQIGLVRLDARRMKQIITNLVCNALKYSDARTEIKISAHLLVAELAIVNSGIGGARKILEIIVEDQGFGMTDEQVKIAFQKYHVVENHRDSKVDSFGLGLAIVKRLVELQDGRIEVLSVVGMGTKIKMKFFVENAEDENSSHRHQPT